MVGFSLLPAGFFSPFSRSRSLFCFGAALRFFPAGGDAMRTAVRLFSRLSLAAPAPAVLRPVRRRETRFSDLRTSHWRFLAMKKRTVETTGQACQYVLAGRRGRPQLTSTNGNDHDDHDDSYHASLGHLERSIVGSLSASSAISTTASGASAVAAAGGSGSWLRLVLRVDDRSNCGCCCARDYDILGGDGESEERKEREEEEIAPHGG